MIFLCSRDFEPRPDVGPPSQTHFSCHGGLFSGPAWVLTVTRLRSFSGQLLIQLLFELAILHNHQISKYQGWFLMQLFHVCTISFISQMCSLDHILVKRFLDEEILDLFSGKHTWKSQKKSRNHDLLKCGQESTFEICIHVFNKNIFIRGFNVVAMVEYWIENNN